MSTKSEKVIKVNVNDEHLKRASQANPADALVELVWNSVDAGATKVDVKINKNDLGGVHSVEVIDNGFGISASNINNTFGQFGASQKTPETYNPRGKLFHGSLGEGRFKAYSLGTVIEWTTFDSADSKKYSIHGSLDKIGEYTIKEDATLTIKKGTHFIAHNGLGDNLRLASSEKIKEKLLTIFAPTLLSDSAIEIRIDNELLDSSTHIELNQEISLDKKLNAICRLVVWKTGDFSQIFWCDESENVKYVENTDEVKSHHGFSLFVGSKKVNQALKDGTIAVSDLSGLSDVKNAAVIEAKNFLKQYDAQKIIKTVKSLKDSEVYPFKGNPTGELEKLERRVFDVCVTKVVQAIPSVATKKKEDQKITFHLLRTAIETSPSAVQHIFENILNLPKDQIDDLSNIIKKFSITGLIKIGKIVSDRRSFITGLETILFDQKYKKHLLERSQLHKILEQESWIFGEDFSLGSSDENLDAVVEAHRKLLKQANEDVEASDGDNKGEKVLIPDLVFGLQYKHGAADRYHHLVVELKRPKCVIGYDEKSQIEQYAAKIASDERFDKQKTKWTFLLISNSIEKEIEENLSDSDGRINPISKNGNVEIFVRPWASVLQSAKGRMQYLWDKAELKSTRQDGQSYLAEKFPDIISNLEDRVVKSATKKKA